jgi:RecA-family ATPase
MSGINGHKNGTVVPARLVSLRDATTIKIRPVHWLWKDRIALGTLCLVGGREGIGKSLFAYSLAAQLTRGLLHGVYAGLPRAVIVAATEDSWEHTIVPRLMAAGADLELIYRVHVTTKQGAEVSLTLPADLQEFERVVREVEAGLILMDPLMSRLSAKIDTHKDAEVRTALEPIVAIADQTSTSIIGLIHVNKSTSTDPLTMLMGSRAFTAVARTVLFVMKDPDDPTKCLLANAKNNLGRMDLKSLQFSIAEVTVADTDEGVITTAQLRWCGESERTLQEAIDSNSGTQADRGAAKEAADWLEDYLTSKGGSAESQDAKQAGAKAGHAERTLKRAASEYLHCLMGPVPGSFPRRTFWALPVRPPDPAPQDRPFPFEQNS